MSILLDPPPLTRRSTPVRAGVSIGLCAVVILVGGDWLGGVLFGPLGLTLDTAVRLIRLVLAVLLIPPALKQAGWPGIRDVGWTSRQTRGERKRDLLIWWVLGVLGVVISGVILAWTGQTRSTGISGWVAAGGFLHRVAVMGLLTGILLETFWRGILYRTCSRVWPAGVAVGGISLLAAWTHAVIATPGSWPSFGSGFWNQVLFGCILCRAVQLRGDIWTAVGLQATIPAGRLWWGSLAETVSPETGGFWTGAPQQLPWGGASMTLLVLVLWAVMEWLYRKKLNTYGRVHF